MSQVASSGDNGGISPYVIAGLNAEAFIADWREFYRQVHNMRLSPTALMKNLPRTTSGFSWGVWVPKGMTPQRAYEMSEVMFKCWNCWGGRSLDDVINSKKELRTAAKRQYVVWCRDRVEADKELKNTSTLQINERQIDTMTLTERLLLEQWFYWKSGGEHLDVKNVTLCSGSQYSSGPVPFVYWNGLYDELDVSWYNADSRSGDIRSREAVSL